MMIPVPIKYIIIILCCLAGSVIAYGQDNYEIQVYGSDLVMPGYTMVELHSNYTANGSITIEDGVRPTQGAEHETIEITHGFNDWLEVGFYYFSTLNPGYGYNWVGDHIRPRVAAPESWKLPVGLSLSTEFGYQKSDYSSDIYTLEIRPIIDKKIGRWYFSLNPVLDYSFKGANAGKGGEFSPDFKFSYDISKKVAFGLEYYGSLGPVTGFFPVAQQEQQIFPAFDLDLDPRWEVNFGAGYDFTNSSDHLIFKVILGRRLGNGKVKKS